MENVRQHLLKAEPNKRMLQLYYILEDVGHGVDRLTFDLTIIRAAEKDGREFIFGVDGRVAQYLPEVRKIEDGVWMIAGERYQVGEPYKDLGAITKIENTDRGPRVTYKKSWWGEAAEFVYADDSMPAEPIEACRVVNIGG